MSGIGDIFKMLLGGAGSAPLDHLEPVEAHQRLQEKNPPQFIDVRTQEEHKESRIPGSRLIPLHELGSRLREIDKVRPVLLYCRSGNRSGMAYQLLKSRGYANVAHIRGGIIAWSRNGLPLECH